MSGKSLGLLSVALLGALCTWGDETEWIGNATGNWSDAPNWSAGVPAQDKVAVIAVSGDMTITITATSYLQRLRVTGSGTLKLAQSAGCLAFGKDNDGTCGVDVGAGVTVTADADILGADASLMPRFVKSGAGTLEVGTSQTNRSFGNNNKFGGVEIREGAFGYSCKDSGDFFNPGIPACITVRSGARLDSRGPNWLVNWGCFDIDAGGVVDYHGTGDFIGGIRGAGTVTNLNGNINVGLRHGPYVFTGRIFGSGSITLQPQAAVASSNSTAMVASSAEESHFVVGPQTLADLKKLVVHDSAASYEKLVQFAPGYPADTVFDVKRLEYPKSVELWLEDPDGNPVTVRSNFALDGDWTNIHPIRGCGNLVHYAGCVVVTNGILGNTGFAAVESGAIQLGSYADPAQDAVTTVSEFRLAAGAEMNNNNVVPGTTPRICGAGRIQINSAAAKSPDASPWIIEDLSLTNGSISIFADQPYPHFKIGGGSSTNVTIANFNNAKAMILDVAGGFLHLASGSIAGQKCEIRQSGGHVSSDLPVTGWYTSGCTNDVFFRATGGVFESRTQTAYGRGLGVDLSGTACLKLRKGVGTNLGAHRLSSDGFSHSIYLSDDAVLDVDELQIASNTNGNDPYYGHLHLDGGTFVVWNTVFSLPYTAAYFPTGFDGRIYFNGTLIKSMAQSVSEWLDVSYITGYVGRGGLRIETAKEEPNMHTRFMLPIRHDPDCDGIDGGLEKTGRGAFVTHGLATYNGTTRVFGGSLREDGSTKSGAPFGSNSVELVNGYLSVGDACNLEFACGEGATVSFNGVSALGTLNNSATITCGPLVRRNHGVLLLEHPQSAATLGGTFKVKPTTAPALRADGLPVLPIFGYGPASGFFAAFDFVTYDAGNGFVPATTVDDFNGGANSLVKITSAARTLTADAQVAGVNMSYKNGNNGEGGLVIGTGRTLTIGNGTGYAPLILNGTSGSSNKAGQFIEGGTIDFGAAEGLILGQMAQTYGWYCVNKIKSVITGTGGVTFAGGVVNDRRMDIELQGVNTWTGGTVIEGVTVKPMVAGALSTGPVTVQGNDAMGGGIWVESGSAFTTIANALTLSGRGTYSYQRGVNGMREDDFGSLCVDRAVTVSGAVTLAADTRVTARGTATLAFTGGISGVGGLNVAGTGTVRLGAGSTYTGGTVIEGVAECATADALGTGPVEVARGGVLRFTNTTPITFTNDVFGGGEIVFAGTAPVTFAGANDFKGLMHGSGALTGAGVSFVKDTPDVTMLTGANTYGGATEVNAGMLVLGKPAATDEVPFMDDMVAHVDPSAPGTVMTWEVGGTTFVTNVVDVDGRALRWSNTTTDAMPQLRTEAMNGRDTLYFDGKIDRLVGNAAIRVRSVFIVFRTPTGNHPSGWGCVGLFGNAGRDCGIRLNMTRNFADDCWMKFGNTWINGVNTRAYPADVPVVGSFMMNVDTTDPTGIGNYWGNSSYSGRTWWGEIAEIICYNRTFKDDEREAVERYLAKKWGAALPTEKLENVLPTTSSVTVADGAAIDLAGSDQTFASLSGAGMVVNSSETVSAVTLGADALNGFTGSLAGSMTLRITGTLTLDPARISVAPTTDLVLGAGTYLDLNGGTLTVRNVSGTGWIRNGTLVVLGEDNRRNPATVIILR